jgi:hypothetical protein
MAAIIGAAVAAFSLGRSGSNGLQQFGRSGPRVDLSAMRHQEELAFISRNELYVVNGATRSIHEIAVTPGWTAFAPTFSDDGKWVAYQQQTRELSKLRRSSFETSAPTRDGHRHRWHA